MKKNMIKTAKRLTVLILCMSMMMQLPALAADIYDTASDRSENRNLLENPDWEEGTDGWDITAYNESGEWEGRKLLHSVISQDVPLDMIPDRQDFLLKYSGSIAVAAEDATQECIGLELTFYDRFDDMILTENEDSSEDISEDISAVYENSSSLVYHEIIMDIPENAAYARVSLSIWKDSRQNRMYFEDLCLETVQKINEDSFYRSAAASKEGSFRKSAGVSSSEGEQENAQTPSSDDELDPEMIAWYEEWEEQVMSEDEGLYAPDIPEFGEPEAVYVMEDGLVQLSDGVTVDFSDSLDLGDQPKLSVRKTPTVTDEELGADYQVYDITLGDLHELDGYFDIRLPYDGSDIEEGQDPAKCVAGMYLNEETGQWESVPYEVDTQTGELILHTNHLSYYGCFEFANEGRRSAWVKDITISISDADPEQCLKALEEITESGGIPGPACRELTKPYLENFLTSYFQASVSDTANLSTIVGNIAAMLVAAAPGLENYLDKNPLPYGLNQALGKAGLSISIISLATMMFKEDKTDNEILSMYKDAAYLLASLSGEATLGTISASVWVIDYALTDMGNYAYNSVKENLTKAYRYYMTTENKWHGKPRTLREWRKILKNAAKNAMNDKNNSHPENAIMDEIDKYCNEFWALRDDVLAEVYDEVGQKGRGLPDAATKKAITDEFKGELMDYLSGVIRAVQKDLYYELEQELDKRLEKVRKLLNTVITFEIQEEAVQNKKAGYAGYTAVFAPLNETADKKDWQAVIGEDGRVTVKATYIAWIAAGQPGEIQLYGPGQKIGTDKPEETVSFELSVPKTIINLGSTSIDDFMGKWYYRWVEIVDEEHDWIRTTTEDIEFIRDGDLVTMYDKAPITKHEYESTVTYMEEGIRGDVIMTGTWSIDKSTGNFLLHVQTVTAYGETESVNGLTIEFHLVDENHMAMKGPGESEYEADIITREGTE